MELVCTNCHAVVGAELEGDWCPACGGALTERKRLDEGKSDGAKPAGRASAEVDHRGIVLPRRHALGGIITPQ